MGTTNLGLVYWNRYTLDKLTGVESAQYIGQDYRFSETKVKSPTTKRVKPAVLKRSWTSFNTTKSYYSQSEARITVGDTSSYLQQERGLFQGLSGLSLSTVPTISVPSGVVDGKLRSQIKSQSANLAQVCAEFGDTCSTVASLTRDVLLTYRKLRRGDLGGAVKSLKDLADPRNKRASDNWLRYQYGILPTISDVVGSLDSLAKRVNIGLECKTEASSSVSYSNRTTNSRPSVYGPVLFYADFEEVAKLKKIVYFRITDSKLKTLSELGFTNPLQLAWELIPYSFVIDQLIPIGDYLGALDALSGISGITVNRSEWRRKSVTGVGGGGSFYGETVISERSSDVGIGSIGMPHLGYKPNRHLTSVVNDLALLRQFR